jgi:GWxTD domain-containing protein
MRTLLLPLLLVALAAPAAAQRGGTRGPQAADSLISLAQETARLGDTTRALKLLERATKTAPGYAPAFYQHGVMLSRATRMGFGDLLLRRAAGGSLERALQLDPDNPRYLIELGRLRLKTPLLRIDAERLFSRALKAAERAGGGHDLAEVNWELGQIFERRYMTTANRRIFTSAHSGFDIPTAAQDFRYTREIIEQHTMVIPNSGELDYRKAEEHYRASLRAEAGHEGAALGLLGLLADQERYEEMLKVARDGAARRPRSARMRMARALALHRVDRDDEAEATFDSALALLDSAERRDMTQLETVLRSGDAKRIDALTGTARAAADSLFWDLADPLRLTPTNEARVEFLSRVTLADLRFSSPEFGQRGWRTDRGIVMVRYGPPPTVASFAPDVNDGRDPDAAGRVTTVWWYPGTNLRFVFVGPPAMNYAFFGGDFRAYAENAREVAPLRFDNVASLRVDSVAVQVARFRGEAGGVDLSVFADIPTRRMLRDVDVQQALLQTAFFVGDGTRRQARAARQHRHSRRRARQRDQPRLAAAPRPGRVRLSRRGPAAGERQGGARDGGAVRDRVSRGHARALRHPGGPPHPAAPRRLGHPLARRHPGRPQRLAHLRAARHRAPLLGSVRPATRLHGQRPHARRARAHAAPHRARQGPGDSRPRRARRHRGRLRRRRRPRHAALRALGRP